MRKSRFTEEQIIRMVKSVEGGMPVAEAKKLKGLEVENDRLKRVVADLTLDKQMLQDVLSRKW